MILVVLLYCHSAFFCPFLFSFTLIGHGPFWNQLVFKTQLPVFKHFCVFPFILYNDRSYTSNFSQSNLPAYLLQRLVMNILKSEGEDKNMKEVQLLLGIVQVLCRQLYSTGNQFQRVLEWVHKLCTEQSIGRYSRCIYMYMYLVTICWQFWSAWVFFLMRSFIGLIEGHVIIHWFVLASTVVFYLLCY